MAMVIALPSDQFHFALSPPRSFGIVWGGCHAKITKLAATIVSRCFRPNTILTEFLTTLKRPFLAGNGRFSS